MNHVLEQEHYLLYANTMEQSDKPPPSLWEPGERGGAGGLGVCVRDVGDEGEKSGQ